MVTQRSVEPSAPRYVRRASPLHVGSAYETQPPDAIAAGMRAVVKALRSGALSEEQAADLLKVLLAASVGGLIGMYVGRYLERGFSSLLENWAQE